MAYVDKDKKEKIRAALKLAIPKSWKWSLAVNHHSTIVLTVYSAPVDLLKEYRRNDPKDKPVNEFFAGHADVNVYHYEKWMEGSRVLPTFKKIVAALNIDNFDKSDPQTDYFHVGHYVSFSLGRWNKPFVVKGAKS